MKPIKLNVKTRMHNYPIIIGSDLISNLVSIFKKNSIKFNKSLLIIDKNVPKKMINKIKKSLKKKKNSVIFFTASESNKNFKNANKIIQFLLKNNFSREDCLISIGGGITGDLSAFAASLFKRGLKFINIPTTLLSQVDSSIGGKTGVNTSHGKNLIGTFYQPHLVVSDTDFLKSLSKREIVCGYGEILKHSLIANKKFYEFLNQNLTKLIELKTPYIEKAIYESCKIKKDVVEKDERENNLRKVLNFGHTFGHAFEASLGYSRKLNHGEAVLLGINMAIRFSFKNNLLKKEDFLSIINHFEKANLPFNLKNYFSIKQLNKILKFMINDKKNNSNQINLILLKKTGEPILNKRFNKNVIKVFLKRELSY